MKLPARVTGVGLWYPGGVSKTAPPLPNADDAVTPAALVRALTGEPGALDHLVLRLAPTVRGQVASVVARQPGRAGRPIDDVVDDLTQEVFLRLLERDAHILRGWDPARGLSVARFAGLVARRIALSILRTHRHHPWAERPLPEESLEVLASDGERDPEQRAVAREALARVERKAETRLTPLGHRLYRRLMVDEEPVDEVCEREAMSADAVYAWRSRLRRLLRATPTWQS